jgi:hypothetical protein
MIQVTHRAANDLADEAGLVPTGSDTSVARESATAKMLNVPVISRDGKIKTAYPTIW